MTRAPRTLARSKRRFKAGKLYCGTGEWKPDLVESFLYRAPQSFSYQWLREGRRVSGAGKPSYRPTKRGRYSCRVTAANAAGPATQTSAPKCAKRKNPSRRGGRKERCRIKQA